MSINRENIASFPPPPTATEQESDPIFSCHLCDKVYQSQKTLSNHLYMHDKVEPNINFKCLLCKEGKRNMFSRGANAIRHVKGKHKAVLIEKGINIDQVPQKSRTKCLMENRLISIINEEPSRAVENTVSPAVESIVSPAVESTVSPSAVTTTVVEQNASVLTMAVQVLQLSNQLLSKIIPHVNLENSSFSNPMLSSIPNNEGQICQVCLLL